MSPHRRIVLLISIMAGTVLFVEAVTIGVLYRTVIAEERARLQETAKSQARLIEAVARFDKKYNQGHPFGSRAATLSQIRDAHANYQGFGETGEFTLSKRENDQIVFLLRHRHYDLDNPKPVPWKSTLAEPMRLALSGKSGTVIGLDYRGEKVLAAFEPVGELELGIVAKIDMRELRSPFIQAMVLSGLVAILVIALGAGLFFKMTDPILKRLAESVEELEKALGEVKTLQGIVPICSHCKRIRDDRGYWDQVEVYVKRHTQADCSHSICPDCMKEYYSDLVEPEPAN